MDRRSSRIRSSRTPLIPPLMLDDTTNPVIAWCVDGMQREGTPDEARASFERAWALRRDDYDACIAAHFVARHQSTPAETLSWNRLALQHALATPDERVELFMASLHLNLGDSLLAVGAPDEARGEAERGRAALNALPAGGYRDFVARGIRGLEARLDSAQGMERDQPSTEEC